MVQNKGLIFKQVPKGLPVPGQDLAIESRDIDLEAVPSGGVITKNLYASFDPYQRGRMREPEKESYSPPYTLGQPIGNGTVSQILKSDNAKFKKGDLVYGAIPTEEYSALDKDAAEALRQIENPYNLDLKHFTGALGMPGLTAYSSLYEIGKPQKGETIFITAASGAVGQLVGQLAKHEGLRVIGSVGSDEKLDYIVKDLKFDSGFNYKKEKPLDALRRLAPEGVDIYYDNVGGEQLEAALEVMNVFGRIIACGMISDYNTPLEQRYGIKNLMNVIAKRITFRGFIVGDKDMGPRHFEARNKNISKWLHEGTFQARMSVTEGIDNGPEGLVGIFQGKNFGKAVLKIADPEVRNADSKK